MVEQLPESLAQADLDRFREEWLSEVARNKRPGRNIGVGRFDESAFTKRKERAPLLPTAPSSSAQYHDFSEEVEPRTYDDLPDQETALRLGKEGESSERNVDREPSTALEHYEHAVEVGLMCELRGNAILRGDEPPDLVPINLLILNRKRHEVNSEIQSNITAKPSKFVRSSLRILRIYTEVGYSSTMAFTKPTRRSIFRLRLS